MNRIKIKKFLTVLFLSALALSLTGVSCSDKSQEHKIRMVRNFFAAILQPDPGLKPGVNPVKAACLSNLEALWFIVNEPEALKSDTLLSYLLDQMNLDTSQIKGKSTFTLGYIIDYAPDSYFEDIASSMEKEIAGYQFDSSDLEQLQKIDIPAIGKNWEAFMLEILVGYFPNLQTVDKKRVIASLLINTTSDSSDADKLLALIYGSGPFFQKYIQLLGDKLDAGDDPNLMALKLGFDNVKSNLPSINPFYVKQYQERIRAANLNVTVTIGKSLGAASVGETFASEIGDKKVVIKLLRPGIEAIANREAVFFERVARNISNKKSISDAMVQSFREIQLQVENEMNLATELIKLDEGVAAYDEPGAIIRVVQKIKDFNNAKEWMAMEFAPGTTFKDVRFDPRHPFESRVNLLIKGNLLELLTKKFIEKAFFLTPNGFFHGDLHQGNIMMYVDPRVYQLLSHVDPENLGALDKAIKEEILPLSSPLVTLTIIDFGNAHALTKNERQAVMNLYVSSINKVNSPQAFLEALNQLLPPGFTIKESALPNLIPGLLERAFNPAIGNSPFNRIGDSVDVLMSNNIPVPGVMFAFSRTLQMMANTYDQIYFDLGDKEFFNNTRVIEKTAICPIVNQVTYGLISWAVKAVLKYADLANEESCTQISDISLSSANKKAYLFNFFHESGRFWLTL